MQSGRIDTDMNPAGGPLAGHIGHSIALGHYGNPTDIANMVAWLASPEAAFVTGTSIKVRRHECLMRTRRAHPPRRHLARYSQRAVSCFPIRPAR
ncbi:hypothetical protein PBS_37650 [Paraburkholderia sp. 2C]